MTKQIIISIAFAVAALTMPANVYADGYGQEDESKGGEKITVVHEVVKYDTAVSDYLNPSVLGAGFTGASAVFYTLYMKAKKLSERDSN